VATLCSGIASTYSATVWCIAKQPYTLLLQADSSNITTHKPSDLVTATIFCTLFAKTFLQLFADINTVKIGPHFLHCTISCLAASTYMFTCLTGHPPPGVFYMISWAFSIPAMGMLLLVASLESWQYILVAVVSAEAAVFMAIFAENFCPVVLMDPVSWATATALTVCAVCVAFPVFQLASYLRPYGDYCRMAMVAAVGVLCVMTFLVMAASVSSVHYFQGVQNILDTMLWDHVSDVVLRGVLVTLLTVSSAWKREMRQRAVMRAIEENSIYKVRLAWLQASAGMRNEVHGTGDLMLTHADSC
jgi:hypothetical protein